MGVEQTKPTNTGIKTVSGFLNKESDASDFKKIILTFPLSVEDNPSIDSHIDYSVISKGKAYKITLKEGLSAPFEARVSVVFTKIVDINVMQGLLSKLVSIELVRESPVTGKHIPSRHLTGVVLSYTYDGVVATSQKETDTNIDSGTLDLENSPSNSTDYYSYTFTITSRIQALSLNKRTRTYVNISEEKKGILSLVDVIKTLFHEYPRVTCDVSKIVDKYKHFNKQSVIYQQIDESDLDFLNRLCLIYGINYSVYYDSTNYKEKIVFSCNSDFSNNEKKESGTDNKSYVLDFDNGTDAEINCEVDYKRNLVSKDNYLLHRAQYDQSVCLSLKLNENADYHDNRSYKDFEVIKNLYLSSRTSKNDITDEETKIIKQSYLGLLNNSSNRFIAKTSDLVFVPGLLLNIKDYFGTNNTARLLVVRTILSFKLKINGVYVDSKEDVEESGIEQQILAIRCEPNTVLGAFCNYPMLASTVLSSANTTTEDAFTTISRKYKNQVTSITNNVLSNNQSKFFIGTVCNENGLDYEMDGDQIISQKGMVVSNKDSLTSKSSLIYVTILGQSTPIVAQCVFNNNGSSMDFVSCLPRVGQKVLVVSVDGTFLVQGVLPSNDGLDVVLPGYDDALQNSCLLIHDNNFQNRNKKVKATSDKKLTKPEDVYVCGDESKQNVKSNMFGFISFDGLTKQLSFLILQELIDNYVQKVVLLTNNKALLTDYKNTYQEQCKSIADSISNLQTNGSEELLNTEYEKLDVLAKDIIKLILTYESGRAYLEKSYGLVFSETNGSDNFTDVPIKYTTLTDQDSNETSIINNNGEISISSTKDISISSGGKIVLNAKDGIEIVDEKGVSISVGRSLQSITQDDIVLTQKAWDLSEDPFESGISLNSVKGTTIIGPGIDIKGRSYVCISEELGSQIYQGYGALSLIGTNVDMTTTTIPRFTSVAIQKIADWSGMIGSSIEKEGKITDEYVVPWIKAVGTSIKYSGSVVERIFDLARRPTDKNLTKSDILVITYNFISDTIYALEAITDQILDTVFDKLKKQAENDQNKLKELRKNYNIIKTSEYCINYAVGILGLVSVYASAGISRISSLSVGPSEVSCNTRKVTKYSQTNVISLSAAAGTTTNVEQQQLLGDE